MTASPPRSTRGLDVGSLGRQGVAAMLVRTIAMRLITAAGTIVLARLLLPADFGVYAVLVVAQQLLTFLADFGIAPSLIQQQEDPDREELATAWTMQVLFAIGCNVLVWLGLLLAEHVVPDLSPSMAWQLRLVSLSLAFTMLRSLPGALLVRVMRFRAIASIELVGHFAFWASAISLALAGSGSWCFSAALMMQTITSCLAANLICRYWPGVHFEWSIARRLLAFGVAYQISNIATTLRDGVVPIFGGIAGGVSAIGYLQFGLRISQLTSSVDEIVARVAFPAFSRIKGDVARTGRVLSDMVTFVALLIAAPQAWLVATSPTLVPIVFGDRWAASIPVLQLMCLGVMAAVPSRIAGSVVFGQGRATAGMTASLATIALLYVLFPTSIVATGLIGGGLAYASASIVGLALQARAVGLVVPFPWLELARVYLIAGIAALAGWLTLSVVPGAAGLGLSAITFGLADLGLLAVFARAQLRRSWDLAGVAGLRRSAVSRNEEPGILATSGPRSTDRPST
jgi:O-antigen/teichoic acid export membrane protein